MVSMTYLRVVALHDGAHDRLIGVRPPEDTGVVQQADLTARGGVHRQLLGDDDGDDEDDDEALQ